ncbi:MAG: PilW family protein [Sulfuritalea sp.]|nr:PilW family protein [Sulfuritalea sp.]
MTPHSFQRRNSGFTLVEVLVGMAIAMIGMVMMFQTMSTWESRKRTTSSGSDAQISGSIGMFMLERDLKLAGYGFGNSTALGCTVSAYDSARTAPGTFTFTMAPVLITDAAGGAPDTLSVLYGSGTLMSSAQTFESLTTTAIKLNTRTGMRTGDLMIAADTGNLLCGLFEVTGNTNADGLSIDHGTGAYTNYTNNQNVSATTSLSGTALTTLQAGFVNNSGSARFNNGTVKTVGSVGSAFNLGTYPRLNVWQITNGRYLTVSNTLENQTTATEVVEGIVNLQAQYGVDADNDGVVAAGEWSAAAPAAWTRLRSIRVGLLARSQQFENTAVTATLPAWAGGAFTMTNLDGTADSGAGSLGPNNWRNYRYRVYDVVIPLRNMLWGL